MSAGQGISPRLMGLLKSTLQLQSKRHYHRVAAAAHQATQLQRSRKGGEEQDEAAAAACLEGGVRVVLEVYLGHVAEVAVGVAGSKEDKLAALLDRAVYGVLNEVDALLGDEARHTGHQRLGGVDGEAEALLQVPEGTITSPLRQTYSCMIDKAE